MRRVRSQPCDEEDGLSVDGFLSMGTYGCGRGLEVEENTFIETEGVEEGVLHHFADRDEIERLLMDFEMCSIDLKEKVVNGRFGAVG